MSMNSFAFVDCKTVNQALDEFDQGAEFKAGGVDLLDLMKERLISPVKLVNLRNIAELKGITVTGEGLRLGPLATLSEIADHPHIRRSYTALSDAAGYAATPQVRNMATVGGNLMQRPRCWYFRSSEFSCLKKGTASYCPAQAGENQYHAIFNNQTCAMVLPSSTAVPLFAMGARVELTSKRGKRTVAMNDFYMPANQNMSHDTAVEPGELITSIFVPTPKAGTRSAYQKYGEKESFDWALADAGVVLVMSGDVCRKASIVLGAAAPTPMPVPAAEAVLQGKRIDEAAARAAGAAAVRNATPMTKNGYKVQLFQTAVYRTILLAAGQMGRDPSAVG